MRPHRLLRWSGTVLSPRTRPQLQNLPSWTVCVAKRSQWSSAQAVRRPDPDFEGVTIDTTASEGPSEPKAPTQPKNPRELPSPSIAAATRSAKLAALHARLSLPERLPIQTLARCLVHPSADLHPAFNNENLSLLGHDVLGNYLAEYILCLYPRLPMDIIYACMEAYAGLDALTVITKEWGVEPVAEPGGEVDPGYLQFKKRTPGKADIDGTGVRIMDLPPNHSDPSMQRGKGNSRWSIANSYFGEPTSMELAERPFRPFEEKKRFFARGVTLGEASAHFVRAVVGAVYLHAGRDAARRFFKEHFQSRKLDVSKMFVFQAPTRELSKLCAREGFQSPVARILSETGRLTRHPIYTVGVFSGRDKLGEGSGASLDEARIKAAISALKGWYLYSPMKVRVPSDMEGAQGEDREWTPALIDIGEPIS